MFLSRARMCTTERRAPPSSTGTRALRNPTPTRSLQPKGSIASASGLRTHGAEHRHQHQADPELNTVSTGGDSSGVERKNPQSRRIRLKSRAELACDHLGGPCLAWQARCACMPSPSRRHSCRVEQVAPIGSPRATDVPGRTKRSPHPLPTAGESLTLRSGSSPACVTASSSCFPCSRS